MVTIIVSFAQFMPSIFMLHVVGLIWEMAVNAFRGRF